MKSTTFMKGTLILVAAWTVWSPCTAVLVAKIPRNRLRGYSSQGAILTSLGGMNHTGRTSSWILDESKGDKPRIRIPKGPWGVGKVTGKGAGKGADNSTSSLTCGVTERATSASDKHERCPAECPFWAQNLADNKFCTHKCVEGSRCWSGNPEMPIPDESTGACSSPGVQDCKVYHYDGTDRCKECRTRYTLREDGLCYWNYTWLVWVLVAVLVVVFVILLAWSVDLAIRPCTNKTNLERGRKFRNDNHLRQPNDESGVLRKWPLSTNLMRVNVAGPGIMLLFRFQAFIIVWALIVGAVWLIFCLFHNDLFVLGTRSFGTPRSNCILVAWGYEKQQALMWTKLLFLSIVYLGTFVLCILFSIQQLQKFQDWSYDHTCMSDFCAMCDGLPRLKGSEKVEEELKQKVEATLQAGANIKVVGVSICWDYRDDTESVGNALEERLRRAEERLPTTPKTSNEVPNPSAAMGVVRRSLFNMETKLLQTTDEAKVDSDEEIKKMLGEMKSTEHAFVVFQTKADRDTAIDATNKAKGFEYRGKTVHLKHVCAPPENVYWHHFGCSLSNMVLHCVAGCFLILLALCVWGVLCYAPFAWSIYTFSYANGAEPGAIYGVSFSLIVTLGNAILYEVCSRVSDWVGFRFRGDRETWYMMSYNVACMLQVLLDMVTTSFTAESMMEGLRFRTVDGTRLTEIHGVELFESYAMQRTLAENAYVYAFPSSMLTPYVLEPFVTVFLPLLLGRLIVRSHPELVGRKAEMYVANAPMDLSRYADLLLNMTLAILIFFFPGGYTLNLFVGMVASHIFIYMFDHWKVLRAIPASQFMRHGTDLWAQRLLAFECGLILSCLVFKANCQGYGYCLKDTAIVLTCSASFVVHVVLHVLLIQHFVPLFVKTEQDGKVHTFKHHATAFACNWFNANPVHCLRSELIYQDSPPCGHYVPGKEHTLERNDSIGCHFSCKGADCDETSDLQEVVSSVSRMFSK